jgi:Uma2 family endonuclease
MTGIPLGVVPDVAVEIPSAQRSYDRMTRRLLYAQARVREYLDWIVDPAARAVEQVVGIEAVAVDRERIRSRVAPELAVELAALFAEGT